MQNLTENAAFDVLKVLRGRTQTLVGPTAGEVTDDEAIDDLLSDQKKVFDLMLSQKTGLSEEELGDLRRAFSTLLEQVQ